MIDLFRFVRHCGGTVSFKAPGDMGSFLKKVSSRDAKKGKKLPAWVNALKNNFRNPVDLGIDQETCLKILTERTRFLESCGLTDNRQFSLTGAQLKSIPEGCQEVTL